MNKQYEVFYLNKSKYENITENSNDFYDIHLREKVYEGDIPNNRSNEEILHDIKKEHTKKWVNKLPTMHSVQINSTLLDLEHHEHMAAGDCVKIGDDIWFLTQTGFVKHPKE